MTDPALMPVQEALDRILTAFSPLETEPVPLAAAPRRVLGADIHAPHALPPFANASMDGFALRYQDARQAPVTLRVVADVPAGHASTRHIGPGEAARITTGAPLPPGADVVVPVEHTDQSARSGAPLPPAVRILQAPRRAGENVRPAGSDLSAGQRVLSAGQVLRPQDVGLLAMLGLETVPVRRRPRVALLSSGDELLQPGQPPAPGKIYDANTFTLGSLIPALGGELLSLGVARDDPQDIRARLDEAVRLGADLILASAGVSVGHRDYIKDLLAAAGRLDLWRINMRPGKPLTFGRYREIPFIGLPGNPVSAFVGFLVFVRPVLRRLLGLPPAQRRLVRARLDEPVASDGRETYLRGILQQQPDGWHARLTGHQGSGHLFSLVQANALLILPAGVKSLPENAFIDAWMFQQELILHP